MSSTLFTAQIEWKAWKYAFFISHYKWSFEVEASTTTVYLRNIDLGDLCTIASARLTKAMAISGNKPVCVIVNKDMTVSIITK